ncbi:armadillo-type protein [Pisolithus croceorrhizus]|nr:armadillo-type protein [Pisolithus croceorrhizus]
MEAVVPQEITSELTQILANLVLGDNKIRSNAEKVVNDRLAQTPDLYLLALAQFAIAADTEVMRSFSLVLLRRLLFRSPPQQHQKDPRMTLYDHMSTQALTTLERLLLHSLSHEPSDSVRRKTVDTVCDLANNAMSRGRPWHALQAQAFSMTQVTETGFRECAFRVFSGSPNLVMDLQTEAVLSVFQKGLQDAHSVDVRLAALRASVSYLTASDIHQLSQSLSLLYPMLETLPSLPNLHLKTFLSSLTSLCSSRPQLFAPHLPALLSFLRALIMPSADPGAYAYQQTQEDEENSETAEDEDKEQVRRAALELMVSLSEARPSLVRGIEGWTPAIVRACLEGMAELPEDGLEIWLETDPCDDATDENYPYVYDQALDRLASALGGKEILPPAFQHIPSMLANYDWRQRHAGLMAIAAIAEGTSKIMQIELGKVVDLVIPMFKDGHPRVRYAACQCLYVQLCTDLEQIIQERHHQQLFAALIPTLEASEHRASNTDTLVPYLDLIVERLLRMLNEQAITSLAMVADASETTFAKHYASIMPLLLNVLRNANSADHQKLRFKAMECAGLIAVAVGPRHFPALTHVPVIDALINIQNSPMESSDTMLATYLIATWAKICQALGPEFEPYLPVVMPALLNAASAKADVSIYDDDDGNCEREGWETISMDGQIVGIRTSTIDEKCQAFDTLVIYCSVLGGRFGPYLSQSPRAHGVREASCRLIPLLFSCGKHSGTLTPQMVQASLHQLIRMPAHRDRPILCSPRCTDRSSTRWWWSEWVHSVPELGDGLIDATKAQLTTFADKRKIRNGRPARWKDFALEDMEKLLRLLDPQHPLLIAVASVRDLGLNQWETEDDD